MNENYIIYNPDIMMGKPVIAGTRNYSRAYIGKASAGESVEQIIKEHPHLNAGLD